jgi:ABC-type dipeptide/oligopeptide/nickel transport system ATPase subunit
VSHRSTTNTQQDVEIRNLKKELQGFEERFRSEVQAIQQHYKASCREWKTKKTTEVKDIQDKLEEAEKKNFQLEVQIKELKLKLEYSETDPRKRSG